ncbi:hypothetical protein [Rhizorhabdus dicambivorans]|uniref:Acyl-CoA dehydrogenase C-terminal domain-containing protein n=1 Tax=Rhizorhabdus dicambivorans TaxID=1850238 RepID=A0A2A4FQ88_9SPHN|nr:hypothetical protein [Rhizorhabdus dicambivorans]ATE65469.1 hypothetical protein CMV14_14545 [Rhizorhabdus dicambivorans]PCE39872.1 hypothetical protein COO09_23245 [Rhizorhabdus dicambivorans]
MATLADENENVATIESADQIVAAITRITPELQELALAEEEARQLSGRTIAALDATRAFQMSIPRAYGGLALPVAEQLRVYTAIGKIAGSTGWVSWVTTTHDRWVAMLPEKAQEDVFGMEWVGPRVSGVLTASGPGKATPTEGGYMVEGVWPFCSGSPNTAWSFLGAIVQDGSAAPDHRMMLIPAGDLEILNDWNVSGLKATGSNTVRIRTPVFVPEHRALPTLGARADAAPPPDAVYHNNFVAFTSLLSGAAPLGMAKGALDYFMARVGKRAITATMYAVQADAAVTHLQLAEVRLRIDAAERVLTEDAKEMDRRAEAREAFDPMFLAKIKFDVAASVRGCAEAVEILHRASGASTIQAANPMQRYARDVRVATIHAQFNYESCAEEYGRLLCGKAPFNPFAAQGQPGPGAGKMRHA